LTPMLLALGETRMVSSIEIASVAMGLGAAFLPLPILGMLGAALSRGISMIAVTSLKIHALRRKIRLSLDLEAIAKSLLAGILRAIAAHAAQTLL
jgi:O-antigen/teichoic acid export membrane protein